MILIPVPTGFSVQYLGPVSRFSNLSCSCSIPQRTDIEQFKGKKKIELKKKRSCNLLPGSAEGR